MHNRISHKDLLNEEQRQEVTDEDSQDGAFSQFEGLSQDDSMSQNGNLKIELVEEDSDMEFIEKEGINMEENSSEYN